MKENTCRKTYSVDEISKRLDSILAMLEKLDAPKNEDRDSLVFADDEKKTLAELLKKMKPVLSSIRDKTERSRVTDALVSAVRDCAVKPTYEQVCAASESAYSARNPHKRKEA